MDQEPKSEEAGGAEAEKPRDVLGYAGPETGRMQVIARFPDPVQAQLAAAKLDAEGIACSVKNTVTNIYALPDPAFLAVQADQIQQAVEILAPTPARPFLTVPPSELPPLPVLPLPTCPRCTSLEIAPVKRWGRVLAGCVVFFLWPVFAAMWGLEWIVESCFLAMGLASVWGMICLRNRPIACAKCGHQWRTGDPKEEP